MTTINFPSTPTLNQEYTFQGKTWIWNGVGWVLRTAHRMTDEFMLDRANHTGVQDISTITGLEEAIGNGAVSATSYLRTFVEGEERTITLEKPIEGAAIVSAQREVPQMDIQTDSWRTWLESGDFDYEDFARPVDLIVGAEVDGMTEITLASGEWTDEDVGRRVEGGGGIAVIQSIDAAQATAFLLESFGGASIPAGQWALYGTSVHDGKLMLGTKAGAGYRAEDAKFLRNSLVPVSSNSIYPSTAISNDGAYLFTGHVGQLTRYTLVKPWDITNYSSSAPVTAFPDGAPAAAALVDSGRRVWFTTNTGSTVTIREYRLSTPYSTTWTKGVDSSAKTLTGHTAIGTTGLLVSPDGRYLYMRSTFSSMRSVTLWHLSLPFDLSTMGSVPVAQLDFDPLAASQMLLLAPDCKTIYFTSPSTGGVVVLRMPAANDLARASFGADPVMLHTAEITGLAFGQGGRKMYAQSGTTIHEYDINAATIPTNTTYTSIYASGIDTEFWTDAHDLAVVEDSGMVYYAVSTDDRTTYCVTNRTDGLRPIVRNNSGTWQVNTDADYAAETWVNAAENDEHKALAEAVTHAANQMTSKNLVLGRSWDLGSIVPGSLVEGTVPQNSGSGLQNFQFQYAGDGSRFWALAPTSASAATTINLKEYTPGTPWGVAAGAAVDKALTVPSAVHAYSQDIFCWSDDGHALLLTSYIHNANGRLQLRRTAQAWRAAGLSAAPDEELTQAQLIALMGGATPTIGCLCIAAGGHRLYLGDSSRRIHQFDLPTPYSLAGMTHAGSFPFTNVAAATMRMSSDGKTAFVSNGTNQASGVRELSLSTPFDITTATLVATHNTGIVGWWMDFANDGMYYYVMETNSGQSTATVRRVSMPPGNPPPLPDLGDTMNMAVMMRSDDGQPAWTKGLSMTYDAHATNQGMTPGVDYTYHQPSPEKVQFKSNVAGNIRVRIV